MKKLDQHTLDARLERLSSVCQTAHLKLTHQRVEIFREIAQCGDHPDAETVFQRVRKKIPSISLDTVYRTLWLLTDLGLIGVLGSSRERTRFDANLDRHHHFVCVCCGATADFYSEALDHLKLPATVRDHGRVDTVCVEARGVCTSCFEHERHSKTFPIKGKHSYERRHKESAHQ